MSQALKIFCSAGKLCQLSVEWYKNNSSVFNTLSDQNTFQFLHSNLFSHKFAFWHRTCKKKKKKWKWSCDIVKMLSSAVRIHVVSLSLCNCILWYNMSFVVMASFNALLCLSSACYGIVQVPTGPWFCRKCESQERAARVVSHTIHPAIHHLWVNSWNNRTVWQRRWTSCSWTVRWGNSVRLGLVSSACLFRGPGTKQL